MNNYFDIADENTSEVLKLYFPESSAKFFSKYIQKQSNSTGILPLI